MQKVKKPVRTISGVTPLTVVLKPRKCNHGTCVYCPGGEYVPQSYTDKSPAVMRALALGFDPYEQVMNRLKVLTIMGHPTDKIEIIVLGGTFLQYDIDYQYGFIKRCFDALNGKDSKTLKEAKKINEKAEHRCVAMCIENRPDNCSPEEIKRMLEFGATRVEIGVQMPDDELYRKTNRGHTVKDVVTATMNLKNAGFKLGYHIMPGLPGSNPKKDIEMFRQIFENENFRPDQLKIYPCQVVQDSPLAKIYKLIDFKPYSEKQTKNILKEMMKLIPEYCRVMRMIREFPKEKMVTGLEKLDLRKDVEAELRTSGQKIKEIRMRETGFNPANHDKNILLRIIEYNASGGKEYFLQIVNKDDVLFGLLRLRITKERSMIRELHVYGQNLNLGKKTKNAAQHKGLGKWLMEEAEKIAKENKHKKIYVISGIGVREYYKKLGYKVEEPYMSKKI
jgi:elongator complex protein 3